jgi:glycine cleavage system aminomethyltransferase T
VAGVLKASFGDPRAEHLATRRAAGLFDFSFMSMLEIAGRDARAFIERLQTRAIARLAPGRIAYTLLLREDGTVFIDATLWRLDDDRWWLFTGRPSDVAWSAGHTARLSVHLRDLSGQRAVLALQGPLSGKVLSRLVGETAVRELAYFSFTRTPLGTVGRLGYSGELGYEVIVDAEEGTSLWDTLLQAGAPLGVRECGFAAADSLRIECGYVLFGKEITEDEDPWELGLQRLVDSQAQYIGRRSLARRAHARRLVAFELLDDAPAEITEPVRVTSECDSPRFGRIGLGFVAAQAAQPGKLARSSDGRVARIAPRPFYDPPRRLSRAAPL